MIDCIRVAGVKTIFKLMSISKKQIRIAEEDEIMLLCIWEQAIDIGEQAVDLGDTVDALWRLMITDAFKVLREGESKAQKD